MSKLARLLAGLRETMEQEAGVGIGDVEVPAAMLLHDVARHLGMTDAQRAEVLGQNGVAYVESVLNEPVRLNGKH